MDTIFIGRYVGAQALAAVNIVSPVFSIFFGMGVMLSVGGTVRSAHHVGRGDLRAASAVFGRTMLLILLAGRYWPCSRCCSGRCCWPCWEQTVM